MTREEEINNALLPILEKMREHGATDEMCKMYNNGFHVGAMWADTSPVTYDGKAMLYVNNRSHENGYKEAVNKAVDWLRVELDKEEELHYIHVHGFDKERREIFLEKLKKAMKGD